jgi:hypothetical protein
MSGKSANGGTVREHEGNLHRKSVQIPCSFFGVLFDDNFMIDCHQFAARSVI